MQQQLDELKPTRSNRGTFVEKNNHRNLDVFDGKKGT
jgi:hypothetical protein